jgi:YbbR domain-containing protein
MARSDPPKGIRNRFEVLSPEEISKTLSKGKMKPDDRKTLIERLRADLKASQAVLLTVVREEERYDIQADLIDASNGSVLKESGVRDVKDSDLPVKLREVVVGLLGKNDTE